MRQNEKHVGIAAIFDPMHQRGVLLLVLVQMYVLFHSTQKQRIDTLAKHNISAFLKQQVLFAGLYLRQRGTVAIETVYIDIDRADTKSFRE